MSRTIRRKKKEIWKWYDCEWQFNAAKQISLTKEECEARTQHLRDLYPKTKYDYEQSTYAARMVELRPYLAYMHSEEYEEVRAFERFKGNSHGKETYREYIRYETAMQRSDHSWHQGSAPGWFVNLYCERPMRRAAKQVIHNAWKYDAWDDMVFEDHLSNADWMYW